VEIGYEQYVLSLFYFVYYYNLLLGIL